MTWVTARITSASSPSQAPPLSLGFREGPSGKGERREKEERVADERGNEKEKRQRQKETHVGKCIVPGLRELGCASQSLLSKVIAVTKAKTGGGYEKQKNVFTN